MAAVFVPQESADVKIGHTDKLYTAKKAVEVHFKEPSDSQENEERNFAPNSRNILCKNAQLCCLHRHKSVTQVQKVIIAQEYACVKVHVDRQAAELLSDRNINYEDIISRCIARLEWNGEEIQEQCLTVFKMKLHGELNQLLKHVVNIIYKEPDFVRVANAVTKLFEHFDQTQLTHIRKASLEFVLQHKSAEEAARVLNSAEIQQDIQAVLMELLPEWAQTASIEWTVSKYTLTESDQNIESEDPMTIIFNTSQSEPTVSDQVTDCVIDQTVRSVMRDVLAEYSKKFETSTREAMQTMMQFLAQQQEQSHSTGHQVMSTGGLSDNRQNVGSEEEDGEVENGEQSSGTQGTEFAQEIGGDSRSSTMIPGGAHHSSISVTEYGQQILSLKNCEGTEVIHPSQSKDVKEGVEQTGVKLSHLHHPNDKEGSLAHKTMDESFPGHIQGKSQAQSVTFQFGQTAIAAPALAITPGPQPGSLGQKHGAPAADSAAELPHSFKPFDNGKSQSREALDHSSYGSSHISGEDISKALSQKSSTETIQMREPRHQPSSKSGAETGDEKESDVESIDSERHERKRSKGSDQESEGDQKMGSTPPRKSKESKTLQAEQLLHWVNVKSKASQSTDPEIMHMMQQVEHALEEEESSPKARALDTVLVLDTSDSVANTHLDQLKAVVHTFVDGIEGIVDTMNLEENLAIIQMGDRAWVRQHLTNDYTRIRDAIDEMTPDSAEMKTGGRTPIFQAMMVCLGAIEGRGGVVNVAGCHRVRPRIIFFTDGRPTDEATEHGSDIQSNVNEVKFALVQLVSEFASKKHKTTPTPIFWVPVGRDPDRPFLNSLAALSGGKVVEPDHVYELCRYYKIQETIGCVYKMVKKHTDVYQSEAQMRPIIEALAGNLEEEEKKFIMEEVRKKQKEPDSEPGEPDDFDSVFEDKELVDGGKLPPLGTRVMRGKNWKWNNQDSEGPGTVIQHRKKRDSWLHVMWDNGTHNAYRYGDGGFFDLEIVSDRPRYLDGKDSIIEVGVVVRRGDDWRAGDEDGNETGVVIRKRKDGKVKVRWPNGHIGKYKFGADGKFEVKVVEPLLPQQRPESSEAAAATQPEDEESLGAVGGYDPSEGPTRKVWFWQDIRTGEWQIYEDEMQEKLKQAYARRKDGSCVITREGKTCRVLFKTNQEKTVDKGILHKVETREMTERQYRQAQGLEITLIDELHTFAFGKNMESQAPREHSLLSGKSSHSGDSNYGLGDKSYERKTMMIPTDYVDDGKDISPGRLRKEASQTQPLQQHSKTVSGADEVLEAKVRPGVTKKSSSMQKQI